MIDKNWIEQGSDDQLARQETIPAWIETEPDHFTPAQECSAAELRSAADGKMLQAKSLMDEAKRLYEIADDHREVTE